MSGATYRATHQANAPLTMTGEGTLVGMTSGRDRCWCCGSSAAADTMVHLGNHPEVALCRGCARWAAKQAWQLDDRAKTGPLVAVRNALRSARRIVVEHGWHRSRFVGALLRWIGKQLP